ncbi:50S ribosomal protein L29 [archaeon]|jgi:ribosomal protein L29|nr:50S ribosomal protein L29 [archaeon]MBT4646835.1 50S ribosomal protein L29 [archaeon]MBT6822080.1 50S ribosomal protein L29 [archaeon]MBT7392569.1 50S ribosomal protein L29 [archaeon]
MKLKELKEKSVSELAVTLNDLRKELIKLNTQVATGTTLKSPGQVKKIKKTIARILTLINQKSQKEDIKK